MRASRCVWTHIICSGFSTRRDVCHFPLDQDRGLFWPWFNAVVLRRSNNATIRSCSPGAAVVWQLISRKPAADFMSIGRLTIRIFQINWLRFQILDCNAVTNRTGLFSKYAEIRSYKTELSTAGPASTNTQYTHIYSLLPHTEACNALCQTDASKLSLRIFNCTDRLKSIGYCDARQRM